jgi:Short C-terminal domain
VKYYVRTVIGLGVLTFCLVAFCYSLYQVLQIGTCASGGPYVSARQCPDSAGKIIVTLVLSVFIGLIGTAIWAARGPAPGSGGGGGSSGNVISAGIVAWSGLFLGGGLTCLWAALGPDADPGPGAKTAGIIIGAIFIPMGLIPLIGMLVGARSKLKQRRASGAAGLGSAAPAPSGGGLGTPSISTAQPASSAVSDTAAAVFGTSSGEGSPWAGGLSAPGTIPPPQSSAAPQPAPGFAGLSSSPPARLRGGGDPAAKLERLAALKAKGVLTDAEFEAAKAKIISDL